MLSQHVLHRARRQGFSAHRRSRLLLERLEDRTMLDAAALMDFQSLAVNPDSYDTSQILVRFQAGVEIGPADLVAGTTIVEEVSLVDGLRVIELSAGVSVEAALEAYRNNPLVVYAEPNYTVELQVTPDDAQFSSLWGLNNTGQTGGTADADIDAPEAWNFETGSGSVIVAVIDTGVDYTHPDLYLNIWINQGEIPASLKSLLVDVNSDGRISFFDLNDPANAAYVSDLNGTGYIDGGDLLADADWKDGLNNDGNTDSNGVPLPDDLFGYDFVNRDPNPIDDNRHGSHVAGTIGAIGDNGVGVAGVVWDVQIMALKFLNASGSGSTADAILALDYAVAQGATISNNSWGGGGYSQALYDAIAAAGQQGHIFVAAAGNDGTSSVFYPAGYNLDNIITVAATDHNDALASFSNFGAWVDLAAPGVSILSTTPDNKYAALSGTSMATPHVAGAIAMIWSLHPDWTYDQVIGHLLASVDPLPSLSGNTATGGRLNLLNAVAPGPFVTDSSPDGFTTGSVSSVVVTFNEAIVGSTFTQADIVSFTGPNGAISVTGVNQIGTRQFEITFASQDALGDYSLVFGPNIQSVSGFLMNQDRDGLTGEDPDDQYTAAFTISELVVFNSADVPAPVLDLTITISYLDIPDDLTIADLNVQLDVTHTWVGDIQIDLYAPDGTGVVLIANRGSSGNNFQGTIFDDEASTPISSGAAPFAGSYRPEDGYPLSVFDGKSTSGTWELWVYDSFPGDEGSLNAWSLIVTPSGGSPPPPPPANDPPTAVDDTASTNEDNSVTINVLGNDTDPENNALTVASVTQPAHGTVVINADQTITYTPAANYNGADSFTYKANDGQSDSDSATVSITVNAVNDAPVAVNDSYTMQKDKVLSGNVLGNDSDVDGNALTASLVSGPTKGTVTLNANGSFTYTPNKGFVGTDTFKYRISDGTVNSNIATVTIRVKRKLTTSGAGANASTLDAVPLLGDSTGRSASSSAYARSNLSDKSHSSLESYWLDESDLLAAWEKPKSRGFAGEPDLISLLDEMDSIGVAIM